MKLTIGWWKARDGSKWHVDWVGEKIANGHTKKEECRCWNWAGKCTTDNEQKDLIAPWTEPKLRPWKPEEVPLGQWIRNKSRTTHRMLITSVYEEGLYAMAYGLSFALAHCEYEHSTDGGKTWHPCGVME